MEKESGKERLFQAEREKILTAWNWLSESGGAASLVALFAREQEEKGGAQLRAIVRTLYPEWFQFDLNVNPEGVAAELLNGLFLEDVNRTSVSYQLRFNNFVISDIHSREQKFFYDGITVDADEKGAISVVQFKNNGEELFFPSAQTFRGQNTYVLYEQVRGEINRSYRIAKRIPQPRRGR